jgi:transposase
MDNYGTHKTPKVRRWFLQHPNYHLHFTPTSASWLNQVERFFAQITTRRIRRGTFCSVRALEQASQNISLLIIKTVSLSSGPPMPI